MQEHAETAHTVRQVKGVSEDSIFLEEAGLSVRNRLVNCQGPGS